MVCICIFSNENSTENKKEIKKLFNKRYQEGHSFGSSSVTINPGIFDREPVCTAVIPNMIWNIWHWEIKKKFFITVTSRMKTKRKAHHISQYALAEWKALLGSTVYLSICTQKSTQHTSTQRDRTHGMLTLPSLIDYRRGVKVKPRWPLLTCTHRHYS